MIKNNSNCVCGYNLTLDLTMYILTIVLLSPIHQTSEFPILSLDEIVRRSDTSAISRASTALPTQFRRSFRRDFHPIVSRGQCRKHVEHTSAAFRIKGVAACALRQLAQPFSRPIFPIPVLVVLFPSAGGPGIPWYSAYTCVRTCGCRAVRNYNGRVRTVRRFGNGAGGIK